MPTTSRPGMGASMRMVRAARAIARSSASASMRDSLTRASGLTSYWVTTGPVLVPTTSAGIWKLRSFSSMIRMLRWWSSAVPPLRSAPPRREVDWRQDPVARPARSAASASSRSERLDRAAIGRGARGGVGAPAVARPSRRDGAASSAALPCATTGAVPDGLAHRRAGCACGCGQRAAGTGRGRPMARSAAGHRRCAAPLCRRPAMRRRPSVGPRRRSRRRGRPRHAPSDRLGDRALAMARPRAATGLRGRPRQRQVEEQQHADDARSPSRTTNAPSRADEVRSACCS